MNHKLTFYYVTSRILLLTAAWCLSTATARESAGSKTQSKPIAEGTIFRAVDGKASTSEVNHEWFFEFDSDVNQVGAVVSAGTKLKLLPCNTLERLADDGNDRSLRPIRLWAMVTQYKGANYLLPMYYLPLRKTQSEGPAITKDEQISKPISGEPNDEIGIPAEIIAMLGQDKTRTQNTERRTQNMYETRTASNSQNRVLTDEVGFVKQDKAGARFVPDAVGRNVSRHSFELLPCRALELAERESGSRRALSEPIRFAIAGLVTQYKGTEYLLLQRATRVYSHGNFTN